ncbi:hypothetical protein Salat_0644000 [Sesamum alatum]|uniref:Uncharacterized protein n=1 Tax=Sesamum alatum TaxID=300844 RepID=A0AAE2CU88_9LAMI|nr:hypothetical protein Salat_0644000 [Sesamum alatum]
MPTCRGSDTAGGGGQRCLCGWALSSALSWEAATRRVVGAKKGATTTPTCRGSDTPSPPEHLGNGGRLMHKSGRRRRPSSPNCAEDGEIPTGAGEREATVPLWAGVAIAHFLGGGG